MVAMAPALRWLHLCDFHQGQPSQKWLWPQVREQFFEDLSKLARVSGPWDVVFFTGDLVNRGSEAEFEAFSKTIEEILSHLTLLCGRVAPLLLAVPGNHDLVRPNAKLPTIQCLQRAAEEPELLNYLLDGAPPDYKQAVDAAFAPYVKWWSQQPVHNQLKVHRGCLPGDFSTTIEKEGVKFGILGLNSSYLQLGNWDARNMLHLDPRQLHAACPPDGPNWIKEHDFCFLLTHHPPSWLHDKALQNLKGEIAPPGKFVVHLFGHMHEGAAESLSRGGRQPVRSWQGRSLFGVEQSEDGKKIVRIHGYAAGQLELAGNQGLLRQWPRRVERSSEGVWSISSDSQEFELQEDGGTKPEPVALARSRESQIVARIPPDPETKAASLSAYVEFCAREYGAMQVSALESGDAQRLLADASLDELYITPVLLDERAVAQRGDEEKQLLQELRTPDLSPSRRAKIQKRLDKIERSRWEAVEPNADSKGIAVAKLLVEHAHSVVIGTPGAGKTTLLRYLAWASVQPPDERARRLGLGSSQQLVPVLVSLRAYSRARRKHPALALEKFIVRPATHRGDRALSAALRGHLTTGAVLLLLDGLDEVPGDANRAVVAQAITTFLSTYPKVRCVVTTRPYGYQPIVGKIAHLRIAPLSAMQMRQLIHRRTEALGKRKGGGNVDDIRHQAWKISHEIESHERVKELAKNPLLLLMICDLCQSGARLPAERVQLYERATSMLLERWNQWRSLATSADVPMLPAAKLRRALSRIAIRQRSEQHPVLHRNQLIRWLAAAFQEEGHSEDRARTLAENYIAAAAGQAGILDERGPGQFVFWHQTFEEYLAAVALVDEGDDSLLLNRATDRAFREVFQLALGEIALVQAEPERAHRLVRALLTDGGSAMEPVNHRRLRVAASSVSEQSWMEPELANEILCRLAELMQHQPYAPLVSELTTALASRPNLAPTTRLVCALLPLLLTTRFRYGGNGRLRHHVLRVLLNGPEHIPDADQLFETLMSTAEEQELRTLAAIGLFRMGRRSVRVLIELAAFLSCDVDLCRSVQMELRAVEAELKPQLLDWVLTEGPGLHEAGAVLLAALGHDEEAVITHLLYGAEGTGMFGGTRGRNGEARWLSHLAEQSALACSQLIKVLKQYNPYNESACSIALRTAAQNSEQVLSALIAALGQRGTDIAPLLIKLGNEDERVLAKLRTLLSTPDFHARYAAIGIINQLTDDMDPELIGGLLGCLAAEDPPLRLRTAARLIGVELGRLWDYVNHHQRRPLTILGNREETIQRVTAALQTLLQAPLEQTRANAAVLLVLLDKLDNAVLDVLTDETVLNNSDQREIWEALASRLNAHRGRLQLRLVQQLGHKDRYARRWIRERLLKLGELVDGAVALLHDALARSDPKEQIYAATVLYEHGHRSVEIQRALATGLDSVEQYEIDDVLGLLSAMKPLDDSVFEILFLHLESTYIEAAKSTSNAEASGEEPTGKALDFKFRLAHILTIHLHQQPARLVWLADAFVSERKSRRDAAHWVARELHSETNTKLPRIRELVRPLLTERLQHITDIDRLWVVLRECDWHESLDNTTSCELFVLCLAHDDEQVRLKCAEHLYHVEEQRDRALTIINASLSSADLDVQLNAAWFLIWRKLSSPQLIDTLRTWLHQESRLLQNGPFPGHSDWFDLAEVGKRRVGEALPPRQLSRLQGLVYALDGEQRDEGRRLSVRATFWLAEFSAVDDATLRTIIEWLTHESPIRKIYAAYLLIMLKKWPPELEAEAVSWLEQEDERLQHAAVLLLSKHPAHAARVDARLGEWLHPAHISRQKIHKFIDWVLVDRQFGKEVVRSVAAGMVRRHSNAGYHAHARLLQHILPRGSRRARLRAAWRAELLPGAGDEASKVGAAIRLYQLGDASEQVLEALVQSWVSIELRDYHLFFDSELRALDIAVLANHHAAVRSSLRSYLHDDSCALRLSAAEILLEAGDSPTDLAPVVRAELNGEESHQRLRAARFLARLGLPEDRAKVIDVILTAARDQSKVDFSVPKTLDPIDDWAECQEACQALYSTWMSEESVSAADSGALEQLRGYLKGRVDAAEFVAWRFRCLASPDDWTSASAHKELAALDPVHPALLRSALTWLADGDEHSIRGSAAVKYLKDRKLLTASPTLSLYHEREELVPDEPARRLQTLAREPAVVPLLAELADPAQPACQSAAIKIRDDQPVNASEIATLASLITQRPDDSFRQRLARAWFYYWLEQRLR